MSLLLEVIFLRKSCQKVQWPADTTGRTDESSHPNVRAFVQQDKLSDAVDLEVTDPKVPVG
jgi:hypothetical protein